MWKTLRCLGRIMGLNNLMCIGTSEKDMAIRKIWFGQSSGQLRVTCRSFFLWKTMTMSLDMHIRRTQQLFKQALKAGRHEPPFYDLWNLTLNFTSAVDLPLGSPLLKFCISTKTILVEYLRPVPLQFVFGACLYECQMDVKTTFIHPKETKRSTENAKAIKVILYRVRLQLPYYI